MRAIWKQIKNNIWFYHALGYAVFGTVDKKMILCSIGLLE